MQFYINQVLILKKLKTVSLPHIEKKKKENENMATITKEDV